jgi:hypothetical protein
MANTFFRCLSSADVRRKQLARDKRRAQLFRVTPVYIMRGATVKKDPKRIQAVLRTYKTPPFIQVLTCEYSYVPNWKITAVLELG